jgi:uncharacterized membrane protein YfcA
MITAWIGAILIGLSLGLLGSGGSILTVPILVYLVKHPEKQSIAESLAIVGAIALFGAIRSAIKKQVVWRAVGWFGLPGIGGSLLGAYLARFIAGEVQIAMLGVIMLVAAARMAMTTAAKDAIAEQPRVAPPWLLVLVGFGLGLVTGLVGIGGGFLIVPALVLLAGVPMKLAVGTSLALIVLNCAVGFSEVSGDARERGTARGLEHDRGVLVPRDAGVGGGRGDRVETGPARHAPGLCGFPGADGGVHPVAPDREDVRDRIRASYRPVPSGIHIMQP